LQVEACNNLKKDFNRLMRKTFFLLPLVGIFVLCATHAQNTNSINSSTSPVFEYVSVRYEGGFKTEVFFPDGKVKRLYDMTDIKRPSQSDNRMFDLTLALNILAKSGYEPVQTTTMTPDDLVLRGKVVRQ
jgi:hypothetical protein